MHVTRIAFVVLALVAPTGCGRHRHRSESASSGDEETSYRGTVTVENRSQLSICSIFEWLDERETVPGTELQVGRIVVPDPESAPIDEPGAVSIALVPHDVDEALRHALIATMMRRGDDGSPFMADAELASELLTMLQRGAQAQGWTERFETAVVAVPAWSGVQQQRGSMVVTVARDLQFVAGARWPRGACTLQSFGARQPFDGDSPQGVIGFKGIGDQLVIPCSLLDEMARFPHAATGG